MVKFLRKSESCGIKIAWVNSISHLQIYKSTLMLCSDGFVVIEGDFLCALHL